MAVDANVLINERIRQELRAGKNPRRSVELGFSRAFWTIIDGHVTTIIAALVLLETNPSGPIRGFAITLLVGLLVSLFTALYCSRLLFDIALVNVADRKLKAWLGVGRKKHRTLNWNFLRWGWPVTIAMVVVSVLVVGMGVTRGLNFGVDFAGGTEVNIGFSQDVEPEALREVADSVGIEGLTVQALQGSKRQYLLRYDESKADQEDKGGAASAAASESFMQFKNALNSRLAAAQPQYHQVDFVGPQVGKELRTQGMLSVLYAILAVLLYIAFRFDVRFAPGAVVKMFLDVFMILGIYVFFGVSFDLVSVAAFLTAVGYSLNDTIVIYDRIRENLADFPRRDIAENVNNALNETLSRSINTSVATMVSLFGILFFGMGQIWYFAVTMTVGIIVATISSTFVSTTFVIWTERRRTDRAKLDGGSAA